MRKASAPVLFLVGLLVAAAVGGAAFGVGTLAGLGEDDDDGGIATPTTPTPTSDPGLTPEQVAVTGTVTTITVDGAVLAGAEVVVPAVTTPSAGLGSGARFEGVVVDGEDAAIAWDAGRPLDLDDATPLRLRPVVVDLVASAGGIVVTFPDGDAVPIVAGEYGIDAPVAVTTSGLGRPRDSVTFTATDASTVAFTGGAGGTMPVGPLVVTGPGRVVLQGALQVRRPDGTVQDAGAVELPTGSFRVHFVPTADGTGYALEEALLEGSVVVG